MDFVAYNVARIVLLPFAHEFPSQRPSTFRNVRAWDQHEYLHVGKAAQFFVGSSNPVLAFWGAHCIAPRGIITGIKIRLCRAIRDRRKEDVSGGEIRGHKNKWEQSVAVMKGCKLGKKNRV